MSAPRKPKPTDPHTCQGNIRVTYEDCLYGHLNAALTDWEKAVATIAEPSQTTPELRLETISEVAEPVHATLMHEPGDDGDEQIAQPTRDATLETSDNSVDTRASAPRVKPPVPPDAPPSPEDVQPGMPDNGHPTFDELVDRFVGPTHPGGVTNAAELRASFAESRREFEQIWERMDAARREGGQTWRAFPHADLVLQFTLLFRSSDAGHYVFLGGKKYTAVERPLMQHDVRRHLVGIMPSVVSVPILSSGNVYFSLLDIDCKGAADAPVDCPALARQVTEHTLPLVVCRSRGGKGAHLYLFLKEKDGFPAETVRKLLTHYAKVLGVFVSDKNPEIFPKQTQLKEGQIGNGANLPLFGSERESYGKSGEKLDLPGFIALAQERQAYGELLMRDLEKVTTDQGAGTTAPPTAPTAPPPDQSRVKVVTSREANFHIAHAFAELLSRQPRDGTGRNEALTRTSLLLGNYVRAGAVPEEFARQHLAFAAKILKLDDHEIQATVPRLLQQGIEKGGIELAKQILATLDEEYCVAETEKAPSIVNGMIYQGTAVQLMGQIKAGKTTFILAMISRILNGRTFIGRQTTPTNVLYVTEQPRRTFESQVMEAGLGRTRPRKLEFGPRDSRLYILDLTDLWSLDWAARAEVIRENAERYDCGLVVIDTFQRVSLIEEIGSAGEANQAFELIAPVVVADNRTLLLGSHERKAGGSIFEAAAGTVAAGGAVDMLLRLQRAPGLKLNDRTRKFEIAGRLPPAFEEPVSLELNESKADYRCLGTARQARGRDAEKQILSLLPEEQPGMTEADVRERLAENAETDGEEPPGKSTVTRTLKILVEKKEVIRSGEGGSGARGNEDPFRYTRCPSPL